MAAAGGAAAAGTGRSWPRAESRRGLQLHQSRAAPPHPPGGAGSAELQPIRLFVPTHFSCHPALCLNRPQPVRPLAGAPASRPEVPRSSNKFELWGRHRESGAQQPSRGARDALIGRSRPVMMPTRRRQQGGRSPGRPSCSLICLGHPCAWASSDNLNSFIKQQLEEGASNIAEGASKTNHVPLSSREPASHTSMHREGLSRWAARAAPATLTTSQWATR